MMNAIAMNQRKVQRTKNVFALKQDRVNAPKTIVDVRNVKEWSGMIMTTEITVYTSNG